MTFRRKTWVSLILTLVLASGLVAGEDPSSAGWFQYRGPNRDGKSNETGLARSWDSSGPREVWRVPVGAG